MAGDLLLIVPTPTDVFTCTTTLTHNVEPNLGTRLHSHLVHCKGALIRIDSFVTPGNKLSSLMVLRDHTKCEVLQF